MKDIPSGKQNGLRMRPGHERSDSHIDRAPDDPIRAGQSEVEVVNAPLPNLRSRIR